MLDAGRIAGSAWPEDLSATSLYYAYQDWCEHQGERPSVSSIALVRDVLKPFLGRRTSIYYEGRRLWRRPVLALDDARAKFEEVFGEPPVVDPVDPDA